MTSTLMNEAEAAQYLGVSAPALRSWRAAGTGPVFLRVGPKRIKYRLDDLERYLADSAVRPTQARR